MLWQAMETAIGEIIRGLGTDGRHGADHARLETMRILGDKIPSKAFNYGVDCHQIKPRLNSSLIITVTEMSECVFPPLEGCFCLLGAIIFILHSFLAQYFETSIVYIFRFPMEIPLRQS
jgi:hypothetical protein